MADDATSAGATSGATGQTATQTGAATTQSPEVFTKEQVESLKSAAINAALKKVREEQAELLAAKDRDAETKLSELSKRAEEAQRYGDFVDAAHSAGIRNIKAAYAVAVAHGHINARGKFDVDAFRKDNPEFFQPAANANAGAGAGGATNTGGMNAYIRQAAGLG